MRRGIWIPEWIERLMLPANERLLLAEIFSLDQNGACFASNEYFAKILGVKSDTITRLVAKLKKRGLIEQTKFDGRKRYLKPVSDLTPSPIQKQEVTSRARDVLPTEADSDKITNPISTVQLGTKVQRKDQFELQIKKFSKQTQEWLRKIYDGTLNVEIPERVHMIWLGLQSTHSSVGCKVT